MFPRFILRLCYNYIIILSGVRLCISGIHLFPFLNSHCTLLQQSFREIQTPQVEKFHGDITIYGKTRKYNWDIIGVGKLALGGLSGFFCLSLFIFFSFASSGGTLGILERAVFGYHVLSFVP